MNKKYLIRISILLFIALICVLIWISIEIIHPHASSKSPINQKMPLPKEVTIILNKNGFTPNQLTIKVGSAVRWKNESGAQQTVNSDNYPTNQLHKELNFGVFNNGSSVVYTFTKAGTYSYHNQFHHTQEGKITVVK